MRGRVPYGDATTAIWHGKPIRAVPMWILVGSTAPWTCAGPATLIGDRSASFIQKPLLY